MEQPVVLSAAVDGVVRVTLNRPQKRNALTRESLGDLLAILAEVAIKPDVRCLILAASGPVFCAGMDLVQMQETAKLPDAAQAWQADTQLYHDVVTTLFKLQMPTVAIVQGPAVAGGLGLVLACDLVLAADSATFSLPEPKRGITAAIVTPLLVHRTGAAGSAWMLLAGEPLTAFRAQQFGICQKIVEPSQLQDAADELVQSILSGAPGALRVTKQQLHSCTSSIVLAQLEEAIAVSAQARDTPEAREGLAAFLENRAPGWQPG